MDYQDILQFTPDHQGIATILFRECDWSWIQQTRPRPFSIDVLNPTIRGQLRDYQMFLLCKIVAHDVQRQPGNTHFVLSATKEIDAMWRRHLLHPASYAATCHALAESMPTTATNKRGREDNSSNLLFKELIDYEPWSESDELDEGRRSRIERFKTLAKLICPNFKFSEKQHEFTIIVKSLFGKKVSITVTELWTVAHLMMEFERVEFIPVVEQRLIVNGKQMEDALLLRDYRLKEGSVVRCAFRLRGC